MRVLFLVHMDGSRQAAVCIDAKSTKKGLCEDFWKIVDQLFVEQTQRFRTSIFRDSMNRILVDKSARRSYHPQQPELDDPIVD